MRSLTMRMIQAPGRVVRQTSDDMMEGHVASELSRVVHANRDAELMRAQGTIDNVAEELVRRTNILGTAIHQIAETPCTTTGMWHMPFKGGRSRSGIT